MPFGVTISIVSAGLGTLVAFTLRERSDKGKDDESFVMLLALGFAVTALCGSMHHGIHFPKMFGINEPYAGMLGLSLIAFYVGLVLMTLVYNFRKPPTSKYTHRYGDDGID